MNRELGVDALSERELQPQCYFDSKDWEIHFGDPPSAEIPKPPWDVSTLGRPTPGHEVQEVRDTHFAFLGRSHVKGESVNLLFWEKIFPGKIVFAQPLQEMSFATRKLPGKWNLSLIGSVAGSEKQSYGEQVSLIPEGYQIPSAIEEVSKYVLYMMKYGQLPQLESRIRCFDQPEPARNVVVSLEQGRIIIDSVPSDQSHENLGVGLALKL